MKAGELEYWLVSPSERLVRVELVHPANRDRHALLQQLCIGVGSTVPLRQFADTGGGSHHSLDQLDQLDSSGRLHQVRRWDTLAAVEELGQAGDETAADSGQQLVVPQQSTPPADSTSPPPSERSITLLSAALSIAVLPAEMEPQAEPHPSAGAATAGSRLPFSALSSALANEAQPAARPATPLGQPSPQLCPTTPPLPQPSPFVLSTDELPAAPQAAATGGAEPATGVAAAADDGLHATVAQPVRTYTVHRPAAAAARTPQQQPSPLLFPRQLSKPTTATTTTTAATTTTTAGHRRSRTEETDSRERSRRS